MHTHPPRHLPESDLPVTSVVEQHELAVPAYAQQVSSVEGVVAVRAHQGGALWDDGCFGGLCWRKHVTSKLADNVAKWQIPAMHIQDEQAGRQPRARLGQLYRSLPELECVGCISHPDIFRLGSHEQQQQQQQPPLH